jgi:hypothetical protein
MTIELVDMAASDTRPSAEIVDFPPSPTLRPDQAVGTCMKTRWTQFLGIGITEAGDFEVVNSDMTAERALWLVKWAERWAMGLDEMEVEG